MGQVATNFAYLATIIAFILALRFLSSPATARRGNWIGAVGMLIAIGVTFAQSAIVSYWEILVGMAIGGAFGAMGARRVKMTAMPQMVALFNGVGGGAAALISLAEFHNTAPAPATSIAPTMTIPWIAFVPDISGVCSSVGTFEITSNPRKIASTRIVTSKESNRP